MLYDLHRINNESVEEIENTLKKAINDPFWGDNLISLVGLRKKSPNGNMKYYNTKNAMSEQKKEKPLFDQERIKRITVTHN